MKYAAARCPLELFVMSDLTDFEVGQELDWLHGLHSHRVATVLQVEEDRVYLSGVTTDYWISKKALIEKVNKPYPHQGASMFACYS